jgi:hypothetical protein
LLFDFHCCRVGRKKWVGANDWQPLPVASVAVGVDSAALQEWVLDRMAR